MWIVASSVSAATMISSARVGVWMCLVGMPLLVALYDATNGDGWRNNTNWLSDESICDWYKVYCNSDGYVDVLYLYSNSLQGTIPTELGLLSSLQVLPVYDNSLQGMIPTELGMLTSLQDLIVHYNSLQGTIPTELGLLTSLQGLWVYGNSLTGTIPTELRLLTSLQGLSVDDNSLTGTIPTELGMLTSLQRLWVNDNSLTGAVPNEVCALRNINGGSMWYMYADCVEELECTCCTYCCVDGGGCSKVVD